MTMHVALLGSCLLILAVMEVKFCDRLKAFGLTDESLCVLEDEGIISDGILRALRREHIMKMLDFMKVGQHALLLEFWDGPSQVKAEYVLPIIIITTIIIQKTSMSSDSVRSSSPTMRSPGFSSPGPSGLPPQKSIIKSPSPQPPSTL